MNSRYYDEGYSLLYWEKEVEAVCPKCGETGVIKGNPSWREWNATFMCKGCSHSLRTERDNWQGPVRGFGKRPCGYCGHKWVYAEEFCETPSSIKKCKKVSSCPVCNKESEVELTYYKNEPEDHAIDPYFGLELALKENTRHGAVWAYGEPHLEELKKYIGAKLREGSSEKWSYLSRLPTWLKSAKNRDMVLKAIGKLEKRLITR